MANDYYDHTTYPSQGAAGSSAAMRAELDGIEAGFGKLPVLTGNGGKIAAVNSGGTALEAITTTGTGSGVRATSPTLVTPNLGTPSALVGTNITGTAAGLTVGNATNAVTATTATTATTVTTNANLTGPITSTGNATAVGAQTGTGSTFVMQASPTLTTPNIGTPSAGVATNLTGLPLTSGVTGTLPVANGGTGIATATAYSPVFTGTTSTGAFQATLGPGSSGQVLTSAGAGALPTWSTGAQKIFQVVEAAPYTTFSSTVASIPADNTIPQIGEGTELMTVSITPTSATNRLRIEFLGHFGVSSATARVVAAMFQDATTNALTAAAADVPAINTTAPIPLVWEMAAGTTSATTFRIRYGGNSTSYINGGGSGALFDGVLAARLRVTEIAP